MVYADTNVLVALFTNEDKTATAPISIPKRTAISSLDPNVPGNSWEARCAEMRIEGEGVPHPGLPHQGETGRIHEAEGVL